VVPEAEAREVTLCLENHSSVHPDADGLLWIIRAVGSVRLRTNPDPTNFCPNFSDQSETARDVIYSETEKVARIMANAHLKIRDFTADGQHKQVNVKRILDIFDKNAYDGYVVLEYYGQDDPANPNKRGVELLRRLIGP
jgi:sugar phosphate isomerase/epimerase